MLTLPGSGLSSPALAMQTTPKATSTTTPSRNAPALQASPTATSSPTGTVVVARKTLTPVLATTASPAVTPTPEPEPIQAPPPSTADILPPELAEDSETAPESQEQADLPASPAAPARIASYLPAAVRDSAGLSLHVLRYVGLVLGAAYEVGVDPAVLAALMEVEGSGETSVSPAGAAGLMQLMPDKLLATDDPFDPATNILRGAQYVARLVRIYQGDLASVAGAYFGAVDHQGNVTDDSDGIINGVEYVTRFAAAYQRWALAFDQPSRPIAIRPVIRERLPTPTELAVGPESDISGVLDGPVRDQWYLYLEKPHPSMPPVFF
jgi:soluble lytic murein transglycosylase-like protein